MPSHIAIAGAGISGLTTAYALEQRGHRVTIFEANDHAGGPVRTIERDGYRLETGPHTLLVRHRLVAEFLDELGLEEDIREANDDASTRYVVRNGRPVPVPMSPPDLLTTDLLTPAARLRLLIEPLIPARDGDDAVDETLASFVQRRLGVEVLDYAVDPLVGGIFAGDPGRLSARHSFERLVEFEEDAGSIVLGAIRSKLNSIGSEDDSAPRRLLSFDGGMQTLVDRLVDRIDADIHFNSPVRKLRRDDDDWRVIYQRGNARRGDSFDAVVLTMPTHTLGTLEWENARPPAGAIDELTTLPYAPCCVVSLGFERRRVGHALDGFGVLVPKVENFHILGSLFVSSMFDATAPDDHVNLTVFVGGARQPELTERSDGDICELALHDVRRLLDIDGAPQFTHLTRWKRAIPQYEVGHQVFLDHIDDIERALPQIYFAGNFRDGIGLPNLMQQAPEHARRIDEALS